MALAVAYVVLLRPPVRWCTFCILHPVSFPDSYHLLQMPAAYGADANTSDLSQPAQPAASREAPGEHQHQPASGVTGRDSEFWQPPRHAGRQQRDSWQSNRGRGRGARHSNFLNQRGGRQQHGRRGDCTVAGGHCTKH